MPRFVMLVLGWAAVAAAAAAAGIAERRPVASDGVVVLGVPRGELAVRGWDRTEVDVTGETDGEVRAVTLAGTRDRLELQVRYADPDDLDGEVELEVRVPRGCRLEIRTVTADVWVDDFGGDLVIATAAGDVDLRGEPRTVAVEAGSSDLVVAVPAEVVNLSTVSGDVRVTGARREVWCRTIAGDIAVTAVGPLARLTCEAVEGDVRVAGAIPRDAVWTVSVQSGDVAMEFDGEVHATFTLQTLAGDLHCGYARPGDTLRRARPGGLRTLECRAGDGSATVQVDVLGGDVAVR